MFLNFNNRNNNFLWLVLILILSVFVFSKKSIGQTNITVTEINYKSDETLNSGDWVELHNFGSNAVDLSGWVFSHEFVSDFFLIPNGTMLSPNEYLVICQDTVLFKSMFPEQINFVGSFNFELSAKKDLIKLFDQSNQEYLSFEYYDTLPWPKSADGYGRTMELRSLNVDMSDGNNWQSSCMGGSPGKSNGLCKEEIIVSEINYKSGSNYNTGDWIELRNVGTQSVDLFNWKVTDKKDSIRFTCPSYILEPFQSVVLAKKLDKFKAVFPNITNVIGPFDFSIGTDGEVIKLYDAGDKLYFSLYYNSIYPWPTEANGLGYTLELDTSYVNINDGASWFAGCPGGSPGADYNFPCYLSINQQYTNHYSLKVSPNPASQNLTISMRLGDRNATISPSCDLFNHAGKKIVINTNTQITNQNMVISADVSSLTNGIYFYQIKDQNSLMAAGKILIMK